MVDDADRRPAGSVPAGLDPDGSRAPDMAVRRETEFPAHGHARCQEAWASLPLRLLNCSVSVEPASAVVEDCGEIAVLTRSK